MISLETGVWKLEKLHEQTTERTHDYTTKRIHDYTNIHRTTV